MQIIDHKGIALAAEVQGDPDAPAVLLVMGATASMLGWPEALVAGLAGRGFRVIRFDHRDTGQSTTVPPGAAGYAIEDMADDALAVLDALAPEGAHVAGMSLGGYLAQMLALRAPGRVASLTLIASEPLGWSGPPLPGIDARFLQHFAELETLDWADPKAVEAFLLDTERLCAAGEFDAAAARDYVAGVLARTSSPASMFNHATRPLREDWTDRFRQIRAPVLVIHGAADPILPPANGAALAAGIAGAESLILPGVGHELPPRALPQILDAMAAHLSRLG